MSFSEAAPLVSCIMPTYNRRVFLPRAILYFLRQDYPNKELVIVDDGPDAVADLIPDHPQIRYIRLEKTIPLGAKRNLCVQQSKGDLIMHWDDDDWMAPQRISIQVNALNAGQAEICGLKNMYFCELSSGKCWLYQYPEHSRPWLAGGSLLYTKSFWAKEPFPSIKAGSDTLFLFSRQLTSYVALSNPNIYVAAIHSQNISPKKTSSSCWHPVDNDVIRNILGADWSDFFHPEQTNGKMVAEKTHAMERPKYGEPPQERVSACLLSYKRPNNLQPIVDNLCRLDFIDEILVWNNNPEIQLSLRGKNVKVINSPENHLCYGRFLCAQRARNAIVYVQDDDALVDNIPQLFSAFKSKDSGIVYGLASTHFESQEQYHHFYGHTALLGWGAFFRKGWLSVFQQFLSVYPEDYLFRREADQFFSLLLQVQHHPVQAKIRLLEGHCVDNIALYRQPDHNRNRALAVNKALAYNRRSKPYTIPVSWNVVIPCHNYGNYLGEAIESVLQNAADYIITVVDDGSTDQTMAIAQQYAQQYDFVRHIRLDSKKGVSYARNIGIASFESLFVVCLDADDKIGPDYLRQAERILREGSDVANPDAILFGKLQTRWRVPESVTLEMLCKKNEVHTCAAFRKSYWAQVGGIDDQMSNWQDYEFWIRLAKAGARIRKVPGDHFFYRKHGESKSSDSHRKQEQIRAYLQSKHPEFVKEH